LAYVATADETVNAERGFYEGALLALTAFKRGRTENQGVIAAVGYTRRL
jgi:hypothetical protein